MKLRYDPHDKNNNHVTCRVPHVTAQAQRDHQKWQREHVTPNLRTKPCTLVSECLMKYLPLTLAADKARHLARQSKIVATAE